jgi:hypothetical protein
VRATSYIQERIKRHPSISNEFPCRSSKMPPDKLSGVASKETEACKQHALPIYHPEEAIANDRCSNECLIEAEEVSEMLESPAMVESQKSSRELLICDRESIQDSVTYFTVLQEASAAEEVSNTSVPFRGSNIIKNDMMSMPIHSPISDTAFTLRGAMHVPSLWAHPASFKDGVSLSSQVFSTLRMSNVVSMRQVASETAHPRSETPLRVSQELSSPQFSEKPSAGKIECSSERSDMAIGLADGQALTLSSFKEGEERWASVAIISTQKKIVSVPSFVLLA